MQDSINTIRGKNWGAGDRRADLNSIALILMACDVGLEAFKKVRKSIKQRNEFAIQYVNDVLNNRDVRMILAHTILEHYPQYDLKEIIRIVRRLTE